LSKGRREGDRIVCGYHGLSFDAGGRCVHAPGQDAPPPAACVRSYPLEERHGLVWIWPGRRELADPALVPDFHWNTDPGWVGRGKLRSMRCDYRLLIDNLMDLTHEAFLHADTIGNRAVAEAPFQLRQDGNAVVLTRWVLGADAPPLWGARLGKPGPVDRWQIIRFDAPSSVTLDVGVAPAGTGAPEGDRSAGINGRVMHAITPETDGSCHLFWNNVRNYRRDDESLTQAVYDTTEPIIAEDRDILEAQQAALDEDVGRPHNLAIDAGAVRARRLIDRMLEAERSAST